MANCQAVVLAISIKKMGLKQVFIANLKKFRKKEGFTQMKLAELCDTSPSYIGEIEIGRKFPSAEMIEKLANTLKIAPYHLFKNNADRNENPESESVYPLLPKSMKAEIMGKIDLSISEILEKY
jgi:transcriptional regulator with XRE-family HTH domain